MLVRTHTAGDKVWIGQGYVQILELPPGVRVKVGYEFPREISIHRDNPPVVVGAVINKTQRAISPDDDCESDCDVDLSVKSSPLKLLGSAVREAQLDSKRKNADYED